MTCKRASDRQQRAALTHYALENPHGRIDSPGRSTKINHDVPAATMRRSDDCRRLLVVTAKVAMLPTGAVALEVALIHHSDVRFRAAQIYADRVSPLCLYLISPKIPLRSPLGKFLSISPLASSCGVALTT